MVATRRAWSVAGVSSTAAVVAAAGGASWYYASRLTQPPADVAIAEPEPHDMVRVEAVGRGFATLSGPDASRPGTWGLLGPDGYGRISSIHADDDHTVTRRFELLRGVIRAEGDAQLDGYAYPPDPTLLAPTAEEILYESGVGPAPAWYIPGSSNTWVIAVHGRAAGRHEAFRLAPTVIGLGHPMLIISYRNDQDAPRSPDNRSHLGHTEWQDVEAAIEHALVHGARDVVLVGYSMGGALVVQCVRNSRHAGVVRALVLEAPVLDWGPVVRRAALARGLPAVVLPALLPATMAMARARVGVDFRAMRSDPAALQVPTLLIHGDADTVVPVGLSDALAHARPDVVTYLRVPGADHVRAWNADPEIYAMSVQCFLEAVV